MMNNFSSIPPTHVLRGIMRHLKKSCPSCTAPVSATHVAQGSVNYDEQQVSIRRCLMSLYREASAQTMESKPSNKTAAHKRRMAHDYCMLLTNLSNRAKLYELDGGVETKLSPKEYTRRAAARAGLAVPPST
jgi:hypothetical protein